MSRLSAAKLMEKARGALEVVSLPALLDRPRYMDGLPLNKGLWWRRCDNVAMMALTEAAADLEKTARGLGRPAKTIVHRAKDTGLKLPGEWMDYLYPDRIVRRVERERMKEARALEREKDRKAKAPLIQVAYPYIREVRGEHADLIEINKLVPAGIREHVRADVCQELMLAILEGKTTVAALKADRSLLMKYVRVFERENSLITSYALSLDKPLKYGGSWYDILPAPTPDEREEPLRSFEDLGRAFPSVVRAQGGREADEWKAPARDKERCDHGVERWKVCGVCDDQYRRALLKREEAGRADGW